MILKMDYTKLNIKILYLHVTNQLINKMYAQSKQHTRFRECVTCFGCETKTGVGISVIFRDRTMSLFSHIIGKLSPRPFE